MLKTFLASCAIALATAGIQSLVLSRSPQATDMAYHHNLAPLGMVAPRRRYRPPYSVEIRGSGRRKTIILSGLG
ncbi:MAG: hypothetical protein AAF889_00015 [Cyanobacteria bacterium P01_D01_bin.73]